MPCSSLADCLPDNPIEGMIAADYFATLDSTIVVVLNIILYLAYSGLVIFLAFNIVQIIYSLMFADSDEQTTYKILKVGLLRAVYCALGLVVLLGASFFLVNMLRLVGVSDGDNIFLNLPFMGGEGGFSGPGGERPDTPNPGDAPIPLPGIS